MSKQFNIRVYAVIFEQDAILLSHEYRFGMEFTKFPGGGLEFGEGILECIQREALEELGQELIELEHFYTTEFYQPSAFHKDHQIISVYYKAKLSEPDKIETVAQVALDRNKPEDQQFNWVHIDQLSQEKLTFPIDKHVVKLITQS